MTQLITVPRTLVITAGMAAYASVSDWFVPGAADWEVLNHTNPKRAEREVWRIHEVNVGLCSSTGLWRDGVWINIEEPLEGTWWHWCHYRGMQDEGVPVNWRPAGGCLVERGIGIRILRGGAQVNDVLHTILRYEVLQ